MSIFPFMQKIDGKHFLVIGAGAVARRKVRLLLQFTDQITLITHIIHPMREEADERNNGYEEKLSEELAAFSKTGVKIINRSFIPEDLVNADYCIASTDDTAVNSQIASLCQSADLPVNVPDDPGLCTFFMPSVIKKGSLVISISTEGSSPALSAEIRRRIDETLPEDIEEILDRMTELRAWLPAHLSSSKERGLLYKELLSMLLDGRIRPQEEDVRAAALSKIRREDIKQG